MNKFIPYYFVRMTEEQIRSLGSQLTQPSTEWGDPMERLRLVYDLRSILRNIEEGVDVSDS
jgi:hypothetical protein